MMVEVSNYMLFFFLKKSCVQNTAYVSRTLSPKNC